MFICLDLQTGTLVTHPLPSGNPGIITFDDDESIQDYRSQYCTRTVKAIRLTKKEAKQLPYRIEW